MADGHTPAPNPTPTMVRYGKKRPNNSNATFWWQDKNGNWHWHPGSYTGPKPETPDHEQTPSKDKSYSERYGGSARKRAVEQIGPRKEDESASDYTKRVNLVKEQIKDRRQTLRPRLLKDRYGKDYRVDLAGSKNKLKDVRTAKQRIEGLSKRRGKVTDRLTRAQKAQEANSPNTADPDSMAKEKVLAKRVQRLTGRGEKIGQRITEERRIVKPFKDRKVKVLNKQFAKKSPAYVTKVKATKEFEDADRIHNKAKEVLMRRARTKKKSKVKMKGGSV